MGPETLKPVLILIILTSLWGCSSCPKVSAFREMEPQSYCYEDLSFALPAAFVLKAEKDLEEDQEFVSWKGPSGLVRLYIQPNPESFESFRSSFVKGIQKSYKKTSNRTIPTHNPWKDQTIPGNQVEILIGERGLAIDIYYFQHKDRLYMVSFQRIKARRGPIDPAFQPVEALFWHSLKLK